MSDWICTTCGVPVDPPSYALSATRRAQRKCAACRGASSKANGRQRANTLAQIEVTPEARQVILGSLLGDGSLERPGNRNGEWGLAIKHALSQEAYLRWKAAKLGSLVRGIDFPEGKIRLRTIRHPVFTALAKLLIRRGRKSVQPELLAEMGALATGVWYFDDGNLSAPKLRKNGYADKATVRFSTCAFTSRENLRLRRFLETKLDVKTTRCTWRNPRTPEVPYEGVRLHGESALKLLDFVRESMTCAGLDYKLTIA